MSRLPLPLLLFLLPACHRAAAPDAGPPAAPPLDASAPASPPDASDALAPSPSPAAAAPPGSAPVTVLVPREVTGDVVVRVDGRTLSGARGDNGAYRTQPLPLARGAHLVVVERPACGASATRYVFVQDEGPREFVAAAPSCP